MYLLLGALVINLAQSFLLHILTAQTFLLSCSMDNRVRVVAASINDGHGPPPNLILSPNCIKDKHEVLLGSHILAFSFMKDDSFFYSC